MSEMIIPIWTEEKLRQLKPNTKFQTQYQDIVTARKIINDSWGWKHMHNDSFNQSLEYNFGEINIIIKTQLIRDNQIHNFDCEFATGRHCNCWCGEKYHGMMGIGAIQRKINITKSEDGKA